MSDRGRSCAAGDPAFGAFEREVLAVALDALRREDPPDALGGADGDVTHRAEATRGSLRGCRRRGSASSGATPRKPDAVAVLRRRLEVDARAVAHDRERRRSRRRAARSSTSALPSRRAADRRWRRCGRRAADPAAAAADFGVTSNTVVVAPSATRPWPAMTTKNSRNARKKFTVTPASTTTSRFAVRAAAEACAARRRDRPPRGCSSRGCARSRRRDRLDAVLGLAATERPQARPEADEELGGLHARAAGGDEVPGLVEHDHEDDAER